MKIAEVQGVYGPIWISEERIQQIWGMRLLRRGKWKTLSGKALQVISMGEWNKSAGPDFRDAILQIGEERVVGDVEIHLYAEDWWVHGHVLDYGYNRVVLHVVLFSGRGLEKAPLREDGGIPETFLMGPWLEEDIEQISLYNGDDLHWLGRMEHYLAELSPARVRKQLKQLARKRFRAKVEMVAAMMRDLSKTEVLRLGLLLVLGYPNNRGVFYGEGLKWIETNWPMENGDTEIWDRLEQKLAPHHGRPKNHPRHRLQQFLQLMQRDCWEDGVWHWLRNLQFESDINEHTDTREVRKVIEMGKRLKRLREVLSAGQFSELLCARFVVDFLLPFKAHEEGVFDLAFSLWFHWLPGDFPQSYRTLFAETKDEHINPSLANGWIQGLYGLRDRLRVAVHEED